MYKKIWIALITLSALSSCVNVKQRPEKRANERPPNIIYILVDDLGYGDLSCYGQQQLETPNIDALAAGGMIFTRHYAGSTVCGPSRASLLTGKHTGHTSVRGNQPGGQLLNSEEITLPEALKSAGYITAMIGKWGVGHPPPPDDPLVNGFDHAFGYINMWHAHNFYPEFLFQDGIKVPIPGNVTDTTLDYAVYHKEGMPEGTGVAMKKANHTHPIFESDALQFIEAYQDTSFFLYLALNIPHANNEAGYFHNDGMEVPNYGQFADQDWPNPEKGFAKMIDMMDQTVGAITRKLEELALDKNTLIIFTSDNGPHQEGGHQSEFFDSNGPLRGKKRDLYEGGIRVPMITYWPGKIEPNTSSNHISAFWDVLPTLCEVAGVASPTDIDGLSFLPTLLGKKDQQQIHSYLYWEFYEAGGKQAVLQNDWKLVKLNLRDTSKPIQTELYDLSKDLSESNNVAASNPQKVEELEDILKKEHTPFEGISLFDNQLK